MTVRRRTHLKRWPLLSAHKAFLSWKKTTFAARAKVMQKAANLLRKDIDAYAKLLTLEMGKVIGEAKAEVELSAAIFEYYAKNAEKLLTPEKLPVANLSEGDAVLVHEPLGVLLAVEPATTSLCCQSDQTPGQDTTASVHLPQIHCRCS
jgi:acyl-CoA reductase-like NAD-dependent aldehyde dehydrogenase